MNKTGVSLINMTILLSSALNSNLQYKFPWKQYTRKHTHKTRNTASETTRIDFSVIRFITNTFRLQLKYKCRSSQIVIVIICKPCFDILALFFNISLLLLWFRTISQNIARALVRCVSHLLQWRPSHRHTPHSKQYFVFVYFRFFINSPPLPLSLAHSTLMVNF